MYAIFNKFRLSYKGIRWAFCVKILNNQKEVGSSACQHWKNPSQEYQLPSSQPLSPLARDMCNAIPVLSCKCQWFLSKTEVTTLWNRNSRSMALLSRMHSFSIMLYYCIWINSLSQNNKKITEDCKFQHDKLLTCQIHEVASLVLGMYLLPWAPHSWSWWAVQKDLSSSHKNPGDDKYEIFFNPSRKQTKTEDWKAAYFYLDRELLNLGSYVACSWIFQQLHIWR